MPETTNITCPQCNNVIPENDGIHVHGVTELHCADCTITCENCDTTFASEDDDAPTEARRSSYRSRPGSQFLCNRCAFTCADCNERFSNDADSGTNANNEQVCARCAEEYHSCEECGTVLHSDDTFSNEDGDGTYCEDCHNRNGRGAIHDYGYRPSPQFFRTREQNSRSTFIPFFFGIEIEAEAPRSADQNEDAESISNDIFYCKRDGSIGNGFEIVSHPCTIEYWRNRNLTELSGLASAGYRSYQTDTCGMHVHVSRKNISGLDQYKLLKFFRDNSQFVFWLSRRKRGNLDQWSAIDNGTNLEFVRKVKREMDSARYCAINLLPRQTIEFRLFRGTLDVPSVRRNIEFVNSILWYCKAHGIGAMTLRNYRHWIVDSAKFTIGKDAAKVLHNWFNEFSTTI